MFGTDHSHPQREGRWTIFALLALGACGVAGQVLLWRELLALYQGNELTTGIILANWLLAEAAGAALFARRGRRDPDVPRLFATLSVAYAAAVLLSLAAARCLRPALGMAIGQPVGAAFAMLTSLSLLAPAALLHGALFPVAGNLCAAHGCDESGSVATLYVWESLGTLLGALGVKLVFAVGGHAFVTVAAVWALTAAALMGCPPTAPDRPRRTTALPHALVAGVVALTVAVGAAPLHRWLLRAQFHPYPVVAHATSPFANWAVLASGGQHIVVADGQPVLLVPEPDRLGAQTLAHIPLLAHPSPRRVAVIGGGLGGLIEEILRHPTIQRVECVESDPALPELYRAFAADLARRELDDPRVHLIVGDGRRALRRLEPGLDIIWIGADEPATLQQNRYFTLEFVEEVRLRLAPDGLLVLAAAARTSLPTAEQRRLHACLHETLRRAMEHVRVMPGDDRILYLASSGRDLRDLSEALARERLAARGLDSQVPMIWPLLYRLHPGWEDWFEREFRSAPTAPNRDLHPRAMFHALADRQAVHEPRLAAALGVVRAHPRAVGAAAAALLLGGLSVSALRARRRPGGGTLLVQVATTGLAGMIWDLVVIVAFQSALGHVQTWIGLLMAAYMLGAAGAAATAGRRIVGGPGLRRAIWLSDALLALACAVLPTILHTATRLAAHAPPASIALFLFANLLGGALTGVLFPLAAAWRVAHGDRAPRVAGALQAADLAGGWTAGLLGAVVLLPLAGIAGACAIVAALKLLSLAHGGITLRAEPDDRKASS